MIRSTFEHKKMRQLSGRSGLVSVLLKPGSSGPPWCEVFHAGMIVVRLHAFCDIEAADTVLVPDIQGFKKCSSAAIQQSGEQ